MTVSHSDHLFHLPKLSDQPYRGQKTLITINIFPTIFFDIDHIIWSAKKRSATFLKEPEPKTDPRAAFLRRPESHTSAREDGWPTFWCRASTNRLVRRRLALLSLHQSSLNPTSPFFWHFSLYGSSFSLLRPPTTTPFLGRDLCVPWEGLFFISSHFSHLFGS